MSVSIETWQQFVGRKIAAVIADPDADKAILVFDTGTSVTVGTGYQGVEGPFTVEETAAKLSEYKQTYDGAMSALRTGLELVGTGQRAIPEGE